MNLEEKIFQTLNHQRLITPHDKVLIGVSGGADSMALLCILNTLRIKGGFQIHVGHINHHLRQKHSDNDENFVKKFCLSLNIPCTCVSAHLTSRIKQGGSLEEIARQERFKALIKIAKKIHANTIALAHHHDDLAETVLLRIMRGTGLQGLQAILPKRSIDGHIFIRPLLNISRKDIEAYLTKKEIKFRTDKTNVQTHFFRNKIRQELIPLLKKEYQNNIQEILCNLAVTAGEDYEYLRQQALKIFSKIIHVKSTNSQLNISLNHYAKLPIAMQRMILRLAIERIKGNTRTLTLRHLQEVADLVVNRPVGTIVNLPQKIRVTKTKNFLQVS